MGTRKKRKIKKLFIECSDYRNVRTGHGYKEKWLKEKGGSQIIREHEMRNGVRMIWRN